MITSFFQIEARIKSICSDIVIEEKKLTYPYTIPVFADFYLSEISPDEWDLERIEDWYIRAITPAIMPHEYI